MGIKQVNTLTCRSRWLVTSQDKQRFSKFYQNIYYQPILTSARNSQSVPRTKSIWSFKVFLYYFLSMNTEGLSKWKITFTIVLNKKTSNNLSLKMQFISYTKSQIRKRKQWGQWGSTLSSLQCQLFLFSMSTFPIFLKCGRNWNCQIWFITRGWLKHFSIFDSKHTT